MTTRPARASRGKKQLPAVVALTEKSLLDPAAGQADSGLASTFIEPERRRAMIAEAAYYRAEQRGFEPGHEVDDWCAAETEIDTFLTRGPTPTLSGS